MIWQRIKNLWNLSKFEPRGLKDFTPKEARSVPVTVLLDSSSEKAKIISYNKRDPIKEIVGNDKIV